MFKRYSLPTTVFAATFVLLGAGLATAAAALTLSVVGASLVDVGAKSPHETIER